MMPCTSLLYLILHLMIIYKAAQHTREHTRAHSHTREHTRAHSHTHTHTHTRTRTHTHTHTHTLQGNKCQSTEAARRSCGVQIGAGLPAIKDRRGDVQYAEMTSANGSLPSRWMLKSANKFQGAWRVTWNQR